MSSTADLGHRSSFVIGTLTVEPANGAVEGQQGRQHVEPRVMQVIVALIEAGGSTLTRTDLITACWNGRVVGDDALNRVISAIRKLAREEASDSFTVLTIPKIGYRLIESDARQTGTICSPAERLRTHRGHADTLYASNEQLTL